MSAPVDCVPLWTVHPAGFDLSVPGLKLDYTRGAYWQNGGGNEHLCQRYREVLPIVHRYFGLDEILWCMPWLTGWPALQETVAWELEAPTSAILVHFDWYRWGHALKLEPVGTPVDPSQLCLTRKYPIEEMCEVLVRWPLGPECKLTRLGPLEDWETVTDQKLRQLRKGKTSRHR
jgi:hypothetical protein